MNKLRTFLSAETLPAVLPVRIPSLDGLRAISIGMVLIGHAYATQNFPRNTVTQWLSKFPVFGVIIFFVISGFLITSLLLKEHAKSGTINLKTFYIRRSLRIFPASLVYISVIAIAVHPASLINAYTFTVCYLLEPVPWVISHLWSLSVEEQFYLAWPFLLVFGFAHRKKIALTCVFAGPLIRLYVLRHTHFQGLKYFPCYADNLIMGCLLALYFDTLKRRCQWLKHPLSLLGSALLMLLCIRIGWHEWYVIYLGGLLPFLIAVNLFALIERRDFLLNNRPIQAIGVLSYSIYLWQQPFMDRNHSVWWTTYPVNLVLPLGCAIISYYLVEQPFVRLYRSRKELFARRLLPDSN